MTETSISGKSKQQPQQKPIQKKAYNELMSLHKTYKSDKKEGKMYIITGLGRCGTSILTKYLGKCGYGLGKNVNWHEEARAGLELSTFYSIIDYMYRDFCKVGKAINLDEKCPGDYWNGYTYREAFKNVDKDKRQGSVDIIKDPRLTWHPDLIEAVWKAREGDFKLIMCHRDINLIMRSRESLPAKYHDPKPRTKKIDYEDDYINFMKRVRELEIEQLSLFFPNFLINCQDTYVKLRDFGLKKCDGTILYNMVNKELIHNE